MYFSRPSSSRDGWLVVTFLISPSSDGREKKREREWVRVGGGGWGWVGSLPWRPSVSDTLWLHRNYVNHWNDHDDEDDEESSSNETFFFLLLSWIWIPLLRLPPVLSLRAERTFQTEVIKLWIIDAVGDAAGRTTVPQTNAPYFLLWWTSRADRHNNDVSSCDRKHSTDVTSVVFTVLFINADEKLLTFQWRKNTRHRIKRCDKCEGI